MSDQVIEKDPSLADDEWCARFVEHMMKSAPIYDGSREELRDYAGHAAKAYLPDRAEYVDPEEAASTDVGYWE